VVPAVLGHSLRRAAARHRHAAGERPLADRRDPARARHAIYLAEYAKPTTGRIVKPVIEQLAGVPTIVFGYFALTFFTQVVYDDLLGMDVRTFNALSAGSIMGFIVLPTVASISEDAMSGSRRRWRQPSSWRCAASRLLDRRRRARQTR